jgi:glycosyltransferase involved in cell wall biosynthesis
VIAGPLVSVVIPAFNAAKYIRETLDSVLAQTYRPIEIVVVDDGSTDGTREQILAYGDRVRYVWQPNSGGCSSPRNYGVRMASGEFIAFLDADDLIAPERIAAAVAVMKRRPDVGLAFTNFAHFD